MYQTPINQPLTPFPTLNFALPEEVEWPAPPLNWRHLQPPLNGVAQPCTVEALSGAVVPGEMLDFNPVSSRLTFRPQAPAQAGFVPFLRFRRLTLTEPLKAAPEVHGAPVERVPAAAQEREYTLHAPSNQQLSPLIGRTAGYVQTEAGIFLFTPVEEEAALERVFVPRSAYSRSEFGPSAEEIASRMWYHTPEALLDAIARQERMPVLPIGQSLLALGLLTPRQLARALAKPSAEVPLGESLVAQRLISRHDLQTALAHKMGYPVVDLTRFPVDPKAVAKLPREVAERYHVLPLMIDQKRLIVAVDSPSRVLKLKSLQVHAQSTIVPVLAPWVQIKLALSSSDMWTSHVHDRARVFLDTR